MPTDVPPPRTLRIVGRIAAVAVLVGVVAAPLTACAGVGGGPVPAPLVGLWQGGAHTNGPWCYDISADGTYRTWPEHTPGARNIGTIVVYDDTIWFSNGGAPITSTWSLRDGVLLLDGQAYRQT